MTRKRKHEDQGDLFAWGAAQPVTLAAPGNGHADPAPVIDCPRHAGSEVAIDFLSRRDKLPRRILNPPPPFVYLDRQIARKHGLEPPAPILPFAPRAGPPGHCDSGEPWSRAG
jgi:hypothetical protein